MLPNEFLKYFERLCLLHRQGKFLDILRFAVTLIVGAIGGWLFLKLNVPSAVLLGAMFGVAVLNIAAQQAYYYLPIRTIIQVASGTIIGSRIRKKDIEKIRELKWPVFIVISGMLLYNLVFGSLVYWWGSLDAATAMLSAAPGGTSDLTLIAPDLGANGPIIAIVHVFRQIITFIMVPILLKNYRGTNNRRKENPQGNANFTRSTKASLPGIMRELYKLTVPLIVSAFFGLMFRAAGLKSGMIVGAMVGAAGYGCIIREVEIPLYVRRVVHVFIGAYIGTQFSRDIFLAAGVLMVPIAVGFAGTVLLLIILPKILLKTTHLPYPVCVLASAPLGLTEMTLMADDINRDYVTPVAIMQTLRMVTVIAAAPLFVMLIE
jgi:membrane AbrB-like protein